MSKTYKYVFARFNENISWILNNNELFNNSIICNKGEPLNISNEILLTNYGKDQASYIYYIINNYENLPDVCIFSQARINDHYIYGEPGNVESLIKLKNEAFEKGESYYSTINCDKSWTKDWNFHPVFRNFGEESKDCNNTKFIDCFNKYIDNKSTDVKRFHPCGIFSASREKILSRTKEYYINIFNELNWHWNCIQASFVERSWYYILNPSYTENFITLDNYLNNNNIAITEGHCQHNLDKVNDLIKLISQKYISIMEIGFNGGHSSEVFLKNNSTSLVTSFDLGYHDYVKHGKIYIDTNYPERHELILGNSQLTVPNYINNNPNKKFDVIFIDGDHSYGGAKADLDNCLMLAHKDTIVIMDDTIFTKGWDEGWTWGPTQVWDEYEKNNKIISLAKKDYCKGHGMSWGKYNI